MKLHLGVIDLPYGHVPTPPRASKKPGKKPSRKAKLKASTSFSSAKAVTTAKVARWLEDKYGVMGEFAKMHEENISRFLADSMSKALDAFMMGAPASLNPFGSATSLIETRFKQYLFLNEIEGAGIKGVPTTAAMNGVNHRLKIKRGAPRPSFIDTGLYESSFKAWIE